MIDNLPTESQYPSEIYRLLRIGDEFPMPETAAYSVTPVQKKTPRRIFSGFSRKFKNSEGKYYGWIIYPLVFIVSFLFFYLAMNLPSLAAQVQGFASNSSQDEQLLQDRLPAYQSWINGYFFSVADKSLLSATSDIDKDGLSNMDEFIVKTNPTIADSDADGISDGIEVINRSNPWGSGKMSKKQQELHAQLDLITVNNRVSYYAAANAVAAMVNSEDKFDLSKPGRLSIPKLKLQVPLIFSETPDDFEADLQKGVIHYPGTALPGENGTVYISGHSSDYLWKKHPYKQVFAKINFLEPGDDIFVDVYGNDGKLYNFQYKVTSEKVYHPEDQTQFIDSTGAKLNLSTCWPIGTQKDRYIVSAELQK